MLGRDDPPEVVAASFALGVGISFTPLLGLHWIIALLLAFLLKLNKVDVILGTLVINPLTIGPVSAVAIPLGRFILRAERAAISRLPWSDLMKRSFWHEAAPRMRAIGLQWGVGMFVLALVSGVLTYVLLVYVIRRHRARLAAADALPPGVVPGPGDDATPPSAS